MLFNPIMDDQTSNEFSLLTSLLKMNLQIAKLI